MCQNIPQCRLDLDEVVRGGVNLIDKGHIRPGRLVVSSRLLAKLKNVTDGLSTDINWYPNRPEKS